MRLHLLLLAALLAVTAPAASEPGTESELLDAMRRAGLSQVRTVRLGELAHLEGALPGEVAEEIVLSARYDTVGAGDDSSGCSGCEVAIAAVADLRRTPLRHTLRVVLFAGEEEGRRGSEAWLADLGAAGRGRILAALDLEKVGGRDSAGLVILGLPSRTRERRFPPGWLVHAVLRSGRAVGRSYAVADRRFPLLAQLVSRSARPLARSDSQSFLGRGVPSLTLSDRSLFATDTTLHLDVQRLDRWTEAVTAAVRRLDGLPGRPREEDQYLVLFGRVWLRRDLMWAGFLLWALLVLRGRPGRWRGSSAAEHGRQMRSYLPGFLFRLLLLLAIFLAPVFSVLLVPAAILALVPPRPVWVRILWIAAGLLPAASLLGALELLSGSRIASLEDGFAGGPAAPVLITAVLLAYAWTIARGPRLTGVHASGKIET